MSRRHVNFIPPELRPKLDLPHPLIPVALFIVFILYSGGSAWQLHHQAVMNEAELARLNQVSADLSKQLEENHILEQNNAEFSALQQVLSRKNYWSEIFKELSILIPEGVWLTNFNNHRATPAVVAAVTTSTTASTTTTTTAASTTTPATGATETPTLQSAYLVLKGEATSQDGVAEFLTTLEQSNHFAGVKISFSEREPNIKPVRYRFEFTIPVRSVGGGT